MHHAPRPRTTHHAPRTTHHAPRTTHQHHAPRTTHHAPRTTHHAPRTTHHAPRTTHHAPRTTHHYIIIFATCSYTRFLSRARLVESNLYGVVSILCAFAIREELHSPLKAGIPTVCLVRNQCKNKSEKQRKRKLARTKNESGKRKAESGKRKAESGKRKAESGKRKAESGKRKAESEKRKSEKAKTTNARLIQKNDTVSGYSMQYGHYTRRNL
jgi:hypothetical protein